VENLGGPGAIGATRKANAQNATNFQNVRQRRQPVPQLIELVKPFPEPLLREHYSGQEKNKKKTKAIEDKSKA